MFFFFKQKTAYEIGLGIPAEPLFRSSLQNTWPYGYSMPIAVRYTQDAFSRSGWLWPVDAKGLGAKEWNNSLKTKLSLLPKKLFRIRMSRNFGMKMLTMTNRSEERRVG